MKDIVDSLALYIWQKARFCSYERQYIIKEEIKLGNLGVKHLEEVVSKH